MQSGLATTQVGDVHLYKQAAGAADVLHTSLSTLRSKDRYVALR